MDSPIYNPTLPHTSFINGGFLPGRRVRIGGMIPTNSSGFLISLCDSDSSNIALYLNPHFPSNVAICNSKDAVTGWWLERRIDFCPVRNNGAEFEINISCEANGYKIFMNGHHVLDYSHRVSVEKTKNIVIEGNLLVRFIMFEGPSLAHYPQNMPIPSAPPIQTFQSQSHDPQTYYPNRVTQVNAIQLPNTATVTSANNSTAEELKALRKANRRQRRMIKLGLMAAGVHGVGVASLVVKKAKQRREKRRAAGQVCASTSSSSDDDNQRR